MTQKLHIILNVNDEQILLAKYIQNNKMLKKMKLLLRRGLFANGEFVGEISSTKINMFSYVSESDEIEFQVKFYGLSKLDKYFEDSLDLTKSLEKIRSSNSIYYRNVKKDVVSMSLELLSPLCKPIFLKALRQSLPESLIVFIYIIVSFILWSMSDINEALGAIIYLITSVVVFFIALPPVWARQTKELSKEPFMRLHLIEAP